MLAIASTAADRDLRVSSWCVSLRERFGLESEIDAPPDRDFDVGLETARVGAVDVTEMTGSAHRWRRRGGERRVTMLASLRGACIVRRDAVEYEIGAGSLVFFPSQDAAELVLEQGFHLVAASFREAELTAAYSGWKCRLDTVFPVECGVAAVMLALLKSAGQNGRCLEDGEREAIGTAILNVAAATLAAIPVAGRSGTRMEGYHVARVKQYIDANLRNAELDVCEIAQAVGLSPRYLHRLFTRDGCHLMQWVWARRLDHCYRELTLGLQPGCSISQVAYSWGFNDAAHFSRVFRIRFGMSPKEARERGRVSAGATGVPCLAAVGT